jgi:hypothetical protein
LGLSRIELSVAASNANSGFELSPPPDHNSRFFEVARTFLEGGHLFHFNLTSDRQNIRVGDPRLEDGVADNICKFDITESESLLFGRNFGIGTDIQTGPNGNLLVVSLANGAIYEIFRRDQDDDKKD